MPPHPLAGDDFEAFKKSCANFVGFRNIDGLPFAETLKKLAVRYRPPGSVAALKKFVSQLGTFISVEEVRALAKHFSVIADAKPAHVSKRATKPIAKSAAPGNKISKPQVASPGLLEGRWGQQFGGCSKHGL